MPSVETGNGLVKMLIYFSGACAAGVVVGGKVPVVITSRSDEAPARLASIAAAVVAVGIRSTTELEIIFAAGFRVGMSTLCLHSL